jgi:hypothetical protein
LFYGGIFDEQTRRKPLAIAADALRYGIEFGIPGVKPFVIQNLGKYEILGEMLPPIVSWETAMSCNASSLKAIES